MNSSMIKALNSMNAYQTKLDVISNNVANSDTVGYKKKSTVFSDLLTNMEVHPDTFARDGRLSPLGFNQGWGSRISSIGTDFTQGTLKETGVLTDLAIEGNGLFEIQVDNAGSIAYTRDGSFQISINAAGEAVLTNSQGYPVTATLADGSTGSIIVPNGYTMQVLRDGTVNGVNELGNIVTLGRLNIVEPIRPDSLVQVADNLFVVAAGANVEQTVARIVPGQNNNVGIRQSYLENSNVDMTLEMTEAMRVQRAYQLAARALSSSDTMMQLANNLRNQ